MDTDKLTDELHVYERTELRSIILTFKAGVVRYVYYFASVFACMSQAEKQKKERNHGCGNE